MLGFLRRFSFRDVELDRYFEFYGIGDGSRERLGLEEFRVGVKVLYREEGYWGWGFEG